MGIGTVKLSVCAYCRICRLEQASPEGLKLRCGHHEASWRELQRINRTMTGCQFREKNSRIT